jgi:hypothetical protein
MAIPVLAEVLGTAPTRGCHFWHRANPCSFHDGGSATSKGKGAAGISDDVNLVCDVWFLFENGLVHRCGLYPLGSAHNGIQWVGCLQRSHPIHK